MAMTRIICCDHHRWRLDFQITRRQGATCECCQSCRRSEIATMLGTARRAENVADALSCERNVFAADQRYSAFPVDGGNDDRIIQFNARMSLSGVQRATVTFLFSPSAFCVFDAPVIQNETLTSIPCCGQRVFLVLFPCRCTCLRTTPDAVCFSAAGWMGGNAGA